MPSNIMQQHRREPFKYLFVTVGVNNNIKNIKKQLRLVVVAYL